MDKKDRPEAGRQPPLENVEDGGSSLGYEQGIEYQYLHSAHPFRFRFASRKRRKKRFTDVLKPTLTPQVQHDELHQREVSTSGSVQVLEREEVEDVFPKRTSIRRAALIITVAMFASRFLGLLRSSLLTAVLGANALSDAYNQATLLPDLIFTIVSGGALASAFIPVFNGYIVGKRDTRTAWHVASSVLNLALIGLILLAILGFIFTEQVMAIYASAAWGSHLGLITTLTRILFLQSIIMGVGIIINSVLNARQHFLLPAIGSVLYPLGTIVGLVPGMILKMTHQPSDMVAVYGATWGVVVGAALMVGIQIPGLLKVGMHYTFSFDWRHPGIWQIARLMAPRIVNAIMLNLSVAVDLALIAYVIGKAGFFTQYKLSFTIVTIPLSIIMAVATAAFPSMTEYVAEGRLDRLRAIVMEALRSILFVSIPASIGLMVLSLPVVQALYEHGSFTQSQAQSTAIPLIGYALGLPGLAAVEILTRSFYAMRYSRLPVFVSVVQFLIKIALSLALIYPAIWAVQHGFGFLTPSTLSTQTLSASWSIGAMALATSIAGLIEAVVLLWLLHRYVGGLGLRSLVSFVNRVLLASLVMSVALIAARWLLDMVFVTTDNNGDHTLSLLGVIYVILKLLIIITIGTIIYLRTARLLQVLGEDKLSSVHRLLIRLRLSWL